MSSFNVLAALDKMGRRDKDFRYMATSDLLSELAKPEFKLDSDAERKVTTSLLKVLEDTSAECRALAVRCIGLVVRFAADSSLDLMVSSIFSSLLSVKEETEYLRDVCSMGLKTIVAEAPEAKQGFVASLLTPQLLQGILAPSVATETKFHFLDVLNDMLEASGDKVSDYHSQIVDALLPLISAEASLRKRSTQALGRVSVFATTSLFSSMLERVLSGVVSSDGDVTRKFLGAFGQICRCAGHRNAFHPYIHKIFPTLVAFLTMKEKDFMSPEIDDDEVEADDEDEELRESCLLIFELFVLRCPREVKPYISEILKLSLHFLKHDPNYIADEMDLDGAESDDSDDEQLSDDADISWKVRRASSKAISAFIATLSVALRGQLYELVTPALIERFSEREENVRMDVFSTFIELLVSARSHSAETQPILMSHIDALVAGIGRSLRDKSPKTRIGALSVLHELFLTYHGVFDAGHLSQVIPMICGLYTEKSSSSQLKLQALMTLRALLSAHDPALLSSALEDVASVVYRAAREPSYKLTSEALRTCKEIVNILQASSCGSFHTEQLRETILYRLQAQTDVDQEVKEAVILTSAHFVAVLGPNVKPEKIAQIIDLLIMRLKNEICRFVAARAFYTIVTAKVVVQLHSQLEPIVQEMCTFLRKANRLLRHTALECLEAMAVRYTSPSLGDLWAAVIGEAALLIAESDIHLSHLALRLTAPLASRESEVVKVAIRESVLPAALGLLRSTLVQGVALESLLTLLSSVSRSDAAQLIDELKNVAQEVALPSRANLQPIATSLAVVGGRVSPTMREELLSEFVYVIEVKDDVRSTMLALLTIGEMGCRVPITDQRVRWVVVSAFTHQSEDVKIVAASALGNLAVGDLDFHLPFVVRKVSEEPSLRYLLLHSLREILTRMADREDAAVVLSPHAESIISLLFESCRSSEEGTRNVVAECLGRCGILVPESLIPLFITEMKREDPVLRSTILEAVKYIITEKKQSIDARLMPEFGIFCEALTDENLLVRKSAFLTVNHAAHVKSQYIQPLLPQILPAVYAETHVRQNLIRIVNLGPLQHRVDDGLDIRKAAFQTIHTLLPTCLSDLDMSQVLETCARGLGDESHDVRMLCHLMVMRLCHTAPVSVVEHIELFIPPLRATVTCRLKESAMKQEVERNEDLIRSAFRAVWALERLPHVMTHSDAFEKFMKKFLGEGELARKYAELKQAVDEPTSPRMSARDVTMSIR